MTTTCVTLPDWEAYVMLTLAAMLVVGGITGLIVIWAVTWTRRAQQNG